MQRWNHGLPNPATPSTVTAFNSKVELDSPPVKGERNRTCETTRTPRSELKWDMMQDWNHHSLSKSTTHSTVTAFNLCESWTRQSASEVMWHREEIPTCETITICSAVNFRRDQWGVMREGAAKTYRGPWFYSAILFRKEKNPTAFVRVCPPLSKTMRSNLNQCIELKWDAMQHWMHGRTRPLQRLRHLIAKLNSLSR